MSLFFKGVAFGVFFKKRKRREVENEGVSRLSCVPIIKCYVQEQVMKERVYFALVFQKESP